MLLSLTVAGAVEALHLIPEHLAACRYHKPMRLFVVLAAFAGVCQGQVQVRDDYGHEVSLPAPARRIVSLSPHLTELLYAAGAGERLVGALEYSDYPPQARSLP